ncbi:uncharacterized protein LOC142335293 [Convolutriloba macropyga]|uniref:uncharacterized protein LOC142335293 n=1 Tax=Convolutriloba macropyga TaxID=536237 RepID=UPI003F51DEBE
MEEFEKRIGVLILMALATVVWSPAAVSGATYSREYTMVGKLANVYQPFGLWYHDLTTERSLEVINHIADDCASITVNNTALVFSCQVVRFEDKTSGAWVAFNVTLTSLLMVEVKSFSYSDMRRLLRVQMKASMKSVYQRFDYEPTDVDRSWMFVSAFMVTGLVIGVCVVLMLCLTVKYSLQQKRASAAKAQKKKMIEEYAFIKEKTVSIFGC